MRLAGLLPKKTYKLAKVSKKSANLWMKARKECLDTYGHKCFICGSSDLPIHVHHIILRSLAPELKYDQNNLVCLCEKCHSHQGYNRAYVELTRKLIACGIGKKYNLSITDNKISFNKGFSDE